MEIVKLEVVEYVYEKVKKTGSVINIPTEPIFYQEDNYREVTGLFPNLNPGAPHGCRTIDIVKIQNTGIRIAHLFAHPDKISDIISRFELKGKSVEDLLVDDVVRYLMDDIEYHRVDEQVFVNKYDDISRKINSFSSLNL